MALYLFRFGYTPETWHRLVMSPEDRRDAVATQVFRAFGGRLQGLWYSFGDQDGFALVELPDAVSAAAASVAATSTGAFRLLETTVLLSVDEMVEAMARAGAVAYPAPGS